MKYIYWGIDGNACEGTER